MATVCTTTAAAPTAAAAPPTRPALTTADARPTSQLSINTSTTGTPRAIPHKHIPYCAPGPRPASRDSPPASPDHTTAETNSLTYPPNPADQISRDPPVYAISAERLSHALDHLAAQPLPAAGQVFPWLHGLHPDNALQLAFFVGGGGGGGGSRKKALRRRSTPKCLRALAIVKAGGDLSHSRLRGALAPEEVLAGTRDEFQDPDPREGFSVRNFHIQAAKWATVSDVVVYCDGKTPRGEAERLARRVSRAQAAWLRRQEGAVVGRPFNTFLLKGEVDDRARGACRVLIDRQMITT